MTRYAQGTSVPIERSKAELERVLARYGAERFGYGTEPTGATVLFQVRGRAVRMRLIYPSADAFKKTPTGKTRPLAQQRAEWEGAVRSSWRALVLVVKAKLEAIESGIATFESEWLAYLVLPGGSTIGERIVPQLVDLDHGSVGPLMLGLDGPKP